MLGYAQEPLINWNSSLREELARLSLFCSHTFAPFVDSYRNKTLCERESKKKKSAARAIYPKLTFHTLILRIYFFSPLAVINILLLGRHYFCCVMLLPEGIGDVQREETFFFFLRRMSGDNVIALDEEKRKEKLSSRLLLTLWWAPCRLLTGDSHLGSDKHTDGSYEQGQRLPAREKFPVNCLCDLPVIYAKGKV